MEKQPKAKKKVVAPAKERPPSEYEALGRSLEAVFASGYISRFRLYWISFTRGLFFGLGATIGGTVVVATFIWIMSHFTELPLIGDLVEAVNRSIGD